MPTSYPMVDPLAYGLLQPPPVRAGAPAKADLPADGPSSPAETGRVLHLINGEHFAGAERVQQNLGLQLGHFGFESHFACLKPGKFMELSGLPEDRVHAVPMRGRFDRRAIEHASQLAKETGCQLLHAHTPRSALVAAFAAHRLGLPWIYHIHSPTARDSTRGWINRINDAVERFSIASCSLMIAVSRSLRREMLSRGVSRRRVVTIANGVTAIDPIVPADRLEQTSWHIGLIALMRPRKGVEVALEAMAELRSQGARLTLELIGGFESEQYQQQVLGRIESLGLSEAVHWSGFTRDIAGAVRRLDALLLPSLFGEGMPMVVLEALSAGVPVVATAVEGTPEVVRHGIEGLLAEPGNPRDLASKLAALIENRQTWAAMSHAAVARHRARFSDVEMARRVARAYQRVLKR